VGYEGYTKHDDSVLEQRNRTRPDDASRVAMLRAQHEEQPDKQHAELDDLAGWLGGAKVGDGDGDVDMEDLATNLKSFRA
jgi:hypothetical protein